MFGVADSGGRREMTFEQEGNSAGGGGLLLVLDRFPQKRELIEKLFHSSSSFQSLCEEYRECLWALRHWRKSTSVDAPSRKDEYTALFEELEQEVLHYLESDELKDSRHLSGV